VKIKITESQFKRLKQNLKEYQGHTARNLQYPLPNEYNDWQLSEDVELISEVFENIEIKQGDVSDVKFDGDEKSMIIYFSTKNENYVIDIRQDNFDNESIGDTDIKSIRENNGNKPVYIFRFGTHKNSKIDAKTITNKGEPYLVLKVVFHYLKQYIEKYDVRIIYFTSEGSQRIKFYKSIINQNFKDFYLFNVEDRLVDNISFMVKKEDYDKTTN